MRRLPFASIVLGVALACVIVVGFDRTLRGQGVREVPRQVQCYCRGQYVVRPAGTDCRAWCLGENVSDRIGQVRPFSPAQPQGAPLTWGAYTQSIDGSQAKVDEATQKLNELNRLVNDLDARSRSLIESFPWDQRQTVAAAMDGLLRRQREAVARNEALQAQIFRLRREASALREQLLRQQQLDQVLLREIAELGASIENVQSEIRDVQERIAIAEANAKNAAAFSQRLQPDADAARDQYWRQVGDFFERSRIGSPRQFAPELTPRVPVTQRRVEQVAAGHVGPRTVVATAVATAANPYVLAGRALTSLASAVAPAARPPASDADGFLRAVDRWVAALNATTTLQEEAQRLSDQCVNAKEALVRAGAHAAEHERERAQNEERRARGDEQLAALRLQLEGLASTAAQHFDRGWQAVKEALFWDLATESLKQVLSPISEANLAAHHFVWVVKAYGTFLKEDLPAAVDLLGPHPSEASKAKWERLQNLEQVYARYWAATLIQAELRNVRSISDASPVGPSRGPTVGRAVLGRDQQSATPGVLARIEKELPREAFGLPAAARYSQRTIRSDGAFSDVGQYAFGRLTGMPIRTVDDLADAIRRGVIDAEEVPVIFVVKNGTALIYNTRTAVALKRAGIPRQRWLAINKTGDPDFDLLVADQLRRNDLSSQGIETVLLRGR